MKPARPSAENFVHYLDAQLLPQATPGLRLELVAVFLLSAFNRGEEAVELANEIDETPHDLRGFTETTTYAGALIHSQLQTS